MSTQHLSRESDTTDGHRSVDSVPALVGALYEVVQPAERGRLLEYLLAPMGVLALVTVANGIFANIRFSGKDPDGHLPLDQALEVQAGDVVALVDRLQMVSVDAVDGLGQLVMTSPAMASTAAAALLVAVLSRRARLRDKKARHAQGAVTVDRG